MPLHQRSRVPESEPGAPAYFDSKPLAHLRLGPKIRIGWYGLWYGLLLLSACVPASIARFIAFELRGIPALGRGLLANLWHRAVIAVLGVE